MKLSTGVACTHSVTILGINKIFKPFGNFSVITVFELFSYIAEECSLVHGESYLKCVFIVAFINDRDSYKKTCFIVRAVVVEV